MSKRVHDYLLHAPRWAVATYSIFFSFSTYFCMYAFRKPFTVGSYPGQLWGVDVKIAFILAQVIGYTLSKFVGIKLISESSADTRARRILSLMAFAQLALVGFALAPTPWRPLFLFLNGLPLGMIWGLVFSYLEGRRLSTLFGASLSVSFIVSSGAVKTVGKWSLMGGISDLWMPAFVGLLFSAPLLLSVYFLDRLPPPTPEEEQLRGKRQPMNAGERALFLSKYAIALSGLTAFYVVLSAYRDFRDNFAREIADALGYGGHAEAFTATELPAALAVTLALGCLVLVRDPKRSFRLVLGVLALGALTIGASTFAFERGLLGPLAWITGVGIGLYLAYVPFNCILYDDFIAATGFIGTAGFMIYVSDAFGYLGSVGVLLYRNFGQGELSWLSFFTGFSYFTSVFCLLSFAVACVLLRYRSVSAKLADHPEYST